MFLTNTDILLPINKNDGANFLGNYFRDFKNIRGLINSCLKIT